MSSRSSNRDRIHWLEAFVRAWDDYVASSQHMHTMNPKDPDHARVVANVAEKQREVTRARNRVGRL